jgi:two-component sensor histidine kinase
MTQAPRGAPHRLPEISPHGKRRMSQDDASLLTTQMNELRHRLRNHLQNMISLIGLQIRRAQSAEAIAALEDLRARFATLTSIYIDLDDSSDRPVALDRFVPDLVRRIGELYDPTAAHAAKFAMMPLTLPGERAAILGQIVVELTMNVYRHAFAERKRGTIAIELSAADGEAMLAIADDGPGLCAPDGSRRHFGFTIVRGLAKGLGGTFEHESRGGLVAWVRFPLDARGG